MEAVNLENESKVKEQADRIEALEQRLNAMATEAREDKGAADLLRQWINSGKVVVGNDGVPNIIGNQED